MMHAHFLFIRYVVERVDTVLNLRRLEKIRVYLEVSFDEAIRVREFKVQISLWTEIMLRHLFKILKKPEIDLRKRDLKTLLGYKIIFIKSDLN